ncbi:MAG: DNA repair protein RecO [Planctomycetota bacterium]|nr:MAG: DNA repair protein RecO [Planctomycetota bacterium]
MPVVRDQAFLLKRAPYGESSLVVHAFTRQHGRVHLIAKGAYRATSRYFCVLDFFDTLDIEWSDGRGQALAILRWGTVLERRRTIAADLERYQAALLMVELTELAGRPDQAEQGLFGLLRTGLDALAAGAAPTLALVVFELGFLQNLGLSPALIACAACGLTAAPVTPDGLRAAFSAGAGGRLCRPCAEEAKRAGRRVGTLPVEILSAAQELSPRGAAEADPIPAPDVPAPDVLVRVRDLLERFLDYHLETRPKTSQTFLSVPNRNAPEPGHPGPAGALP